MTKPRIAFRNFENAPKNTGYTAVKLDSKVLCKAKCASVATKGVGQFYSRQNPLNVGWICAVLLGYSKDQKVSYADDINIIGRLMQTFEKATETHQDNRAHDQYHDNKRYDPLKKIFKSTTNKYTVDNFTSSSFYWASVAYAPNVLQPYWLPLDVPDLTASLLL